MCALRVALSFNALTCAGFGLLFLLSASEVGAFLGAMPPSALEIVGAGLFLHGAHLVFGSLRSRIWTGEVVYFSIGDLLWFLGSMLILAASDLVSSPQGVIATLGVGVLVAAIGLFQLWHCAEEHQWGLSGAVPSDLIPPSYSRLAASGYSWVQMKIWVKMWLFALNVVFLAALFFWPDEFAQVTLIGFVATGPLLAAGMIVQRGLTKLLGVAHLIPWIPLVAYIILRLSSDLAGPRLTLEASPDLFVYALVLFAFVAVCLAFDIYDMTRWFSGDHSRIGSPAELAARQRLEAPA